MKVYRMIPKDLDFLEKPDKVIIEEYEGFIFNTTVKWLNCYKKGRIYVIIDPSLGLPVFTTTKKDNIDKIAGSKMKDYYQNLCNHKELVVRINRTYEKALDKYKKIKELQEASDFEPLRELAYRGSNTQGGKLRILDAFLSTENKFERINFLKKEYGIGGFGTPRSNKNEFELSYGMWDASKLEIKWYIPECEDEGHAVYTYNDLEKEIDKLIKSAKYI